MRECIFCYKKNGCKILNVKVCIGEGCSFAKTKEEAETSLNKAFKKLASLDKEKQIYISDKYYDGSKPWLKGGK